MLGILLIMQPSPHGLAVRMAQLARATAARRDLEEILRDVTTAAVELIPGADTAGILLVTEDGYESHAAFDEVPHELDELQHLLHEGPCLDAAVDETIVCIEDFRTEKRWPAYSSAVAKVGVLSGLSFKLYTADRTAGALNLFGFDAVTWDTEAQTTGTVLAAHAAAAILAGKHNAHQQSALLNEDRIGQAKGMLMERFGIDDMAAFELLRQLSQETNTRLVDIAERIIDKRGG